MGRFIDVNDDVADIFLRVVGERFPVLGQLKIKLVFDTKKRVKQGELCLAVTELANDKIKYFSKDDMAIEGYDIVITFDQRAWELASEKDRIRIMSHELRHIFIDEKGKIRLVPHDVSDFRIEQKLNEDDPDWSFKLVSLLNAIYEQEKETKDSKGKGELNG